MIVLPLALLVASAVGLSDQDLADALKGEVPAHTESFTTQSGKSAGRGVGAIVIDRPMAEVWTTLSRYEDKAEYQPRVESVTVLDRLPDRIRARLVVDASVTTARYTAWFVFDPRAHTIHWTLDPTAKDNTIAAVDGDYRLFEVSPTRTLVVYRTYVDSGHSVPVSIQNYFARKSIPNLLHALKKRVESGGSYKK
jgi:carbon monoxide dehydrogenase subunit G